MSDENKHYTDIATRFAGSVAGMTWEERADYWLRVEQYALERRRIAEDVAYRRPLLGRWA